MKTQLMAVPFHGDDVVLVHRDDEPYVAMKPVVENMGLTWQSQHAKLTSNGERWGITIIVIPSMGGPQEVTALPLRKLASWLMTISPNRVKPELREKIIRYQEKCDDVLWQYWTKGQNQLIAMLEERASRILPLPGIKRSARDASTSSSCSFCRSKGATLPSYWMRPRATSNATACTTNCAR
ncbi:phage antirepressor N-terminal domain-containing protein [Pseudomonas japonica]|uniref:phage antirepressor N-terminal domain-containing protein n=1 Tax=Pseudomonas japonica TaxID=256466 RepID=UPI0015E29E32|nr:phage antirepressor N-terminal domain-containing protein [Pseudomonas japonica]MBA1289194.1 hypothetical protein [Pseudomonas japonica]